MSRWLAVVLVCGCIEPVGQRGPTGSRQYSVVLTRTKVDGTCGPALPSMVVDADLDTRRWRAGRLDVLARGDEVLAAIDSSNDCRFPDAGCTACVVDGGPLANVCQVRLDPVPRRGLDAGSFTVEWQANAPIRFEATFPAQTTALTDGGVLRQEALRVKLTWNDVSISTARGQEGETMSATLEREEDACRETYRAIGLSPLVRCASDAECTSPKAVAIIGNRWVAGRPGADGGLALTDAGTVSVKGGVARLADDGGLRWPDGFTVPVDGQGRLLTADGGLIGASLFPGPYSAAIRAACDFDRGVCVAGP